MRKLFFTIISALSLMLLLDGRAGAMTADDRYAIVAGIGNYPPESGWSRIHGDRDVKIVTEMLLKNGFPEDNIFVLADSAATKSAIEAAFRELAGTLSEGDIVYVHFSAHGQQVTDIDGDEPDGLVDSDYAKWEWTGIDFAEIQEEDTETGLRDHSGAFYLHESEMKEFYLTYKEEGQKDRPGSFQTIIPRNRIFPLKIYLTDYHLDIKVEHSEPPIGVYPNPTPTENGYDITLPAGCEFTITIQQR